MDSQQPFGCLAPKGIADDRAPVAALGDVAVIAETLHQHVPCRGDALRIPARGGWLLRETEAGDRRDHQMEGVFGLAAMGRRIGERPDNVQQLEDRTGPAMRHDERQRVLMLRTNVDEMNVQAVDVGQELGYRVQLLLGLSPVVGSLPIVDQLPQFVGLDALRAVGHRFTIRPPRRGKTLAKVDQRRLGNFGPERPDLSGSGRHCVGGVRCDDHQREDGRRKSDRRAAEQQGASGHMHSL